MLGYNPIFINFFRSKVTVQKRNQSTWIRVCVLTHTQRMIFKMHYSVLCTNKDIIQFTFLSIAAMENFSYFAHFFFLQTSTHRVIWICDNYHYLWINFIFFIKIKEWTDKANCHCWREWFEKPYLRTLQLWKNKNNIKYKSCKCLKLRPNLGDKRDI